MASASQSAPKSLGFNLPLPRFQPPSFSDPTSHRLGFNLPQSWRCPTTDCVKCFVFDCCRQLCLAGKRRAFPKLVVDLPNIRPPTHPSAKLRSKWPYLWVMATVNICRFISSSPGNDGWTGRCSRCPAFALLPSASRWIPPGNIGTYSAKPPLGLQRRERHNEGQRDRCRLVDG